MSTEAIQTATKWAIDKTHTHIHFKVRHLMISTVTGSLGSFEGTFETGGADFSGAKASFSADVATFSTGDASRDGHLQTADFFDATTHPKLIFNSNAFEKTGENKYKMTGILEIRGISKEISLNVEHTGIAKDPCGNIKSGFNITGTVNRKDWGLNWNAVLEAGGFMLQDEVKIDCEVQLAKVD